MEQEYESVIDEKNKIEMDQEERIITTDLLDYYRNKELLFSLKPAQLSILNQTFRPLMVAILDDVTSDYVYLKHVNIKMQNAQEFVFPTPLIIPIKQIAWFMEFDYDTRISIY